MNPSKSADTPRSSDTSRNASSSGGGDGERRRRSPRRGRSRSRKPRRGAPRRSVTSAALRHLGWSEICERYASLLRVDSQREAVLAGIDRLVERGFADEALDSHVPHPALTANEANARLFEVDGFEFLMRAQEELRQRAPDREALPADLGASMAELETLDASFRAARRGEPLSLFELLGVRALLESAHALGAIWNFAMGDEMSAWRRSSRGLASDADRGLKALESRLQGSESPAFRGDFEFLEELRRCIDFNEDGEIQIADAASETLATARRELRQARRNLERRAEGLIKSQRFEGGLQDRFWTEREGRVVIPLRSDAMGRFADDAIIHGSSQRGHTLFVEPRELVAANNALRATLLRIQEEEERIMAELSARAVAREHELLQMQSAFFALDAVSARHALGELWNGKEVELIDIPVRASTSAPEDVDGTEPEAKPLRISLPTARHPLMLLDGVDVVPNDIELDHGAGLIISGPNAGGKTVALKTLGLCVLLARAGIRVPAAAGAKLPAFTHIVTDVGDDQSIAANLSTFSAHMEHVKEALECARLHGPQTLVLFDEIAVGTDPEQGAALAEAIVSRLVKARVTLVVTTHYERLKQLAGRARGRFINAAVGFDLETLSPTFQLSFGVPGSSSAIAVARRLGVEDGVLVRAEKTLGDKRRRTDELLREIEAERVVIEKQKRELEHRLEAVARREKKLELREAKAVASAHQKRQRAIEAAADEIWALEKDLKDKRKHLRKIGADPDIAPTRDQVTSSARQQVEQNRARATRDAALIEGAGQTKVSPPRKLEVGERVKVAALDEQGEVLAIRGDRVVVQLPLLKTTVRMQDLILAEPEKPTGRVRASQATPILSWSGRAGAATAARHFGDDAVAVSQSVDNRCDLRGVRVEDAFDVAEKFFDDALQSGQDVVVVIHGHGSGELRRALRDYLRTLKYIRKFRPGLQPEGGEGVTVVWLDG